MSKADQIKSYLEYFVRAETKYNIHSPFVFDFVQNILEDERHFYAFSSAELVRTEMKQDERSIQVMDLGAGSMGTNNTAQRKVKEIAQSALSSPWQCEILFKIINFYQPNSLLELGTSLGISTIYQALARKNINMVTMEGSPEIAKIARSNFKKQEINNIRLIEGNFDETLPKFLSETKRIDYAFVDGNHREKATIQYFEMCLPYCHEDSILIFDDIHWSKGMEAAWEKIIASAAVTLSLDLYYFGIVFFKKDFKEKEKHRLIHSKYKPWSMGFFG